MFRRSPIVCVLLLSTACSTVGVPVPVLRPARIDTSRYPRMAVGETTGYDGPAVAAHMERAITELGLLKLVERRRLDAVEAEQRFGASGRVAEGTAVSIGQMEGAAAVILVDADHAATESLGSQQTQCAVQGKLVACTINTRTVAVELKAALKVIAGESSAVVGTEGHVCRRQLQVQATDAEPPAIDWAPALADCQAEAGAAFVRVVSPYREVVVAPFRRDSDLKALDTGIAYAKQGEWDQAVEVFRGAVEEAQARAAKLGPKILSYAQFDLGLAYAYKGDFETGLTHMNAAFRTFNDDGYLEQVAEIKRRIAERKRLQEQTAPAAPQGS